MFEDEIEEPEIVITEKIEKKTHKNRYLDFKLNQHLKMMGIKPVKKDNFVKEKS